MRIVVCCAERGALNKHMTITDGEHLKNLQALVHVSEIRMLIASAC